MTTDRKVAWAAILAACLLLVGQFVAPHIDFGSIVIPTPFEKPDIGSVVILDDVTNGSKIVAKIRSSDFIATDKANGFEAFIYPDNAPDAKPYMAVTGSKTLPVAVVLEEAIGTEAKVIAVLEIGGLASVDEFEAALKGVGRYGSN